MNESLNKSELPEAHPDSCCPHKRSLAGPPNHASMSVPRGEPHEIPSSAR
jgi:hypothetical protein